MKKCPACEAVFEDSTLVFCTNCGANLVDNGVTEPNPQPTPPPVAPQYNYNHNNQYNTPPCKYCTHCGNPCDPKAVICVKCGMPFADTYHNFPREDDKPSGILKFFCFFIPILGLVLYLINMKDKPISAKAYGKSALIGFIIGIVLYVLLFVFSFLFPFFMVSFDPVINGYEFGTDILNSGICSIL